MLKSAIDHRNPIYEETDHRCRRFYEWILKKVPLVAQIELGGASIV